MTSRAKAKFIETIKLPPPPQARIRSTGLTDAVIAAEWLNAARNSKMRARVLQIRDELETLGKMLDSLSRKTQACSSYKRRAAPLSPKELEQIHDAAQLQERIRIRHNALNVALSGYALCPVMAYDVISGNWRYNAISRKSRGREIPVQLEEVTVQVDATSVVFALVRLAASRQLYKLRLCEQCKRVWRVSERDIDRFCSAACRQAAYKHRPEYKARRREILKRHRQNEKENKAREHAYAEKQKEHRDGLAALPLTKLVQGFRTRASGPGRSKES